MYDKILVPVDGSETSTRGLSEAIRLAKIHGSQLRLLHIVNEFILDVTYSPGLYPENLIDSLRSGGKVHSRCRASGREQRGRQSGQRDAGVDWRRVRPISFLHRQRNGKPISSSWVPMDVADSCGWPSAAMPISSCAARRCRSC